MKKGLVTSILIAIVCSSMQSVYATPKPMPDGSVFDAEYYYAAYPDVANAVGKDEAKLYEHYMNYGKHEGRNGVKPAVLSVTMPIYPEDHEASNVNARKACDTLNGYVVKAGESFSYNKALGKRTEQNGYVVAHVVGGMDFGGGICKISTGLYQVILQDPNIKVKERHPHSVSVDYAAPGMDAAVSWGVKDLRFKNNTGKDITISASYDKNGYHISIQ